MSTSPTPFTAPSPNEALPTSPAAITSEIASLRRRLAELESALSSTEISSSSPTTTPVTPSPPIPAPQNAYPLTPAEYAHYGRQLLLPQIGLPGQLLLKRSHILIIGLGGLGSPASLYLASAGIGHLTLLDPDTVEASNLHRQTIHRYSTIGLPKVHSAASALRDLNPHVEITPVHAPLTAENAVELIEGKSLVLDCTDRAELRYLISDACVIAGVPLVSASALRLDGQLIVLNHPVGVGPCYRCIWPRAPPRAAVMTCGEGGVLGPVVGVMGVMQALEAIKVLTGIRKGDEKGGTRMEILSAGSEEGCWRGVRMRGRRKGCIGCDDAAEGRVTRERMERGGMEEYVTFCGGVVEGVRVGRENRATVEEVKQKMGYVIDVRDKTQFGICNVRGSVNVPFEEWREGVPGRVKEEIDRAKGKGEEEGGMVYLLCRFGNDSQIAVRKILEEGGIEGSRVKDVIGGTDEWARKAPEDGLVRY